MLARKKTANSASSRARWGRRTAPRRCRRMSTIPASAPLPSTSCRGLSRTGARPGRRRRRCSAGRNDFRYAQRQGRDFRDRETVRGTRHPIASDDFVHHHRSLAGARYRVRRRRRTGIRSRMQNPCRWASIARWGRRKCARISRRFRGSPIRLSAPIRTRDCPIEFGRYDESPEYHGGNCSSGFASAGLVNIIGGCCGTTPEHIAAIAEAVEGKAPRRIPDIPSRLRLEGLEPFELSPESPFVNIGERTNVTGSARFPKLIKEGDYGSA